MISKYTCVENIDDDLYAIYNRLLFKPIFANNKEVSMIMQEEVDNSIANVLYEKGIYVDENKVDEIAFERLKSFVWDNKRKVRILYLIVSTYCNLNCKYCFIEQNPHSTTEYGIMSYDTAIAAVDQFFTNQDINDENKPEIIFYGGEPLIAQNTVKDTIQYIREKYGNLAKITIISNGTLVDDDFAKFMYTNRVGMGISIDGPKSINDSGRIFRDEDKSVYDNVREKINVLKKYNCMFGLSITITPETIKKKHEIIEWIINLDVSDVFWNLYHFSKYDEAWAPFYEEMSDFILESYDKLLENGIKEGRVSELLNLYFNDTFRYESCGALGLNQVAIAPNGDIFICHGDNRNTEFVCANIQNDTIETALSSKNAKLYDGLLTVDREECQSCNALYICGGGCPSHAGCLFGDRKKIDYATCVFYKKYLTWILKKVYNNTINFD